MTTNDERIIETKKNKYFAISEDRQVVIVLAVNYFICVTSAWKSLHSVASAKCWSEGQTSHNERNIRTYILLPPIFNAIAILSFLKKLFVFILVDFSCYIKQFFETMSAPLSQNAAFRFPICFIKSLYKIKSFACHSEDDVVNDIFSHFSFNSNDSRDNKFIIFVVALQNSKELHSRRRGKKLFLLYFR